MSLFTTKVGTRIDNLSIQYYGDSLCGGLSEMNGIRGVVIKSPNTKLRIPSDISEILEEI